MMAHQMETPPVDIAGAAAGTAFAWLTNTSILGSESMLVSLQGDRLVGMHHRVFFIALQLLPVIVVIVGGFLFISLVQQRLVECIVVQTAFILASVTTFVAVSS